MRSIKLSRYTIFYHTKNGHTYFYNTLFNSLSRLNPEYSSKITNIDSIDLWPNDIKDYLLKLHFLYYEDDIIESNVIKDKEFMFFSDETDFAVINFVTSLGCNLNCPYCYENHSLLNYITKERYDDVIEHLANKKYRGYHFSWFGGEPLLRINDICYFLSNLISKNAKSPIPFTCDLTTNATLLTLETIKLLVNLGIDTYQITLDGIDENSHNKTRKFKNGTGSFDLIMSNLRKIKSADIKCKIVIRFNVANVRQCKPFIDFFKSEFGNDNRFSCLLFPISKWSAVNSFDNYCDSDVFDLNKIVIKEKANSEYLNILINSNLFCEYGFSDKIVINPNNTIGNCTLQFENVYGKSDSEHLNEIKNLRKKYNNVNCYLYPKCFGFRCKNMNVNDNECRELRYKFQDFLYEYFEEHSKK